uniref:Molybdenum cofactor biosynthesis protein B n=1 Tax=Candidatus Kentrum eta TaxID=2126337 RepID=A0A450VQJ6_9GAMM|nr:MAG: molybdenum cofactor biosynthesis protein B [Candidatus Kentron sp. H]VFK04218.1 MAG: molybdenum cofactor biosynthesis protein B [Candidatus Kentron sp. H]VFK07060.1 MAG: molybdenum cofactor biosynthesis protein B [Candidatus Kentron sp. H]
MTYNAHGPRERYFIPLRIAVLTISDSSTEETDTSGKLLVDSLTETGHLLVEKGIVKDNMYEIRAILSRWIASPEVQAVVTTGGTGLTSRDGTPEAIIPLLDKEITGFGEIFRFVSFEEIKTTTLQSRALAGIANGTYIFCLPGSSGACKTGWNLIEGQLDYRTQPCNFVELIPQLFEHSDFV